MTTLRILAITLTAAGAVTPTLTAQDLARAGAPLPYGAMAARIASALDAGGDRVILRYDPEDLS